MGFCRHPTRIDSLIFIGNHQRGIREVESSRSWIWLSLIQTESIWYGISYIYNISKRLSFLNYVLFDVDTASEVDPHHFTWPRNPHRFNFYRFHVISHTFDLIFQLCNFWIYLFLLGGRSRHAPEVRYAGLIDRKTALWLILWIIYWSLRCL